MDGYASDSYSSITDQERAKYLSTTYTLASHGDMFGYEHSSPPDPNFSLVSSGRFVLTASILLFDYYPSLLRLSGVSMLHLQNSHCSTMHTDAMETCRGSRCGMVGTSIGRLSGTCEVYIQVSGCEV